MCAALCRLINNHGKAISVNAAQVRYLFEFDEKTTTVYFDNDQAIAVLGSLAEVEASLMNAVLSVVRD
jgi:hypothetical protein